MTQNVEFIAVKFQATYDTLTTKNPLALYWVQDTQRFYKGDQLYGIGLAATSEFAGLMSSEDKKTLDMLVTASSNNATIPKLTSITMFANAWQGTASPYSQVVECSGVTVNSKLDLQPAPTQLAYLQDAEISLMATNTDGIVTVYSFNDKPTNDMEMQVLITEVDVI